nr:hypothetical protein CFP56_00309 [Quercus suber]
MGKARERLRESEDESENSPRVRQLGMLATSNWPWMNVRGWVSVDPMNSWEAERARERRSGECVAVRPRRMCKGAYFQSLVNAFVTVGEAQPWDYRETRARTQRIATVGPDIR